MKDFTDPDTHFEIITSDTPYTVDGFNKGEPTGEVRCEDCGQVAMNIDEIPHDPDCPQRWVRSRWWVAHFFDDDGWVITSSEEDL